MAGNNSGRLGFRVRVKRSLSSFQGTTTSLGSANFSPSSCLQGEEISVVSGNRVHVREKCCRGTSYRSLDTGVLFPDVSCLQEVRLVEADHRSKCSQRIHCQPSFQMETPRSVISAIRWAISIDLKDAYFHIAILKSARKFLRFTFNSKFTSSESCHLVSRQLPWCLPRCFLSWFLFCVVTE